MFCIKAANACGSPSSRSLTTLALVGTVIGIVPTRSENLASDIDSTSEPIKDTGAGGTGLWLCVCNIRSTLAASAGTAVSISNFEVLQSFLNDSATGFQSM